jgi:hypothetical protein
MECWRSDGLPVLQVTIPAVANGADEDDPHPTPHSTFNIHNSTFFSLAFRSRYLLTSSSTTSEVKAMKRLGMAAQVAGAMMLSALFSMSAFADSRHQDGTWRGDTDRYEDQQSRRGEVRSEGRIRSISRERGVYRIELDRSRNVFYARNLEVRNGGRYRMHVKDLRIGQLVRLYGEVDRRGEVRVTAADWIASGEGRRRNDDAVIGGTIERLDHRRNTVVIREARSGRFVTVLVREDRGERGLDHHDLRRGDSVRFAGEWNGNGRFEAYRIDGVRTR